MMDYVTFCIFVCTMCMKVPKGSVHSCQYLDLAGGHQIRLAPLQGSPDSEVLCVQGGMELYGGTHM